MGKIVVGIVLALAIAGGSLYWGLWSDTPDTSGLQTSLLGSWQSTDDANYIIRFKPNGEFVERYADEKEERSTWQIVERADRELEQRYGVFGQPVLMIQRADGQYYYGKISVTPDHLLMFYLDSGKKLEFQKIGEE